MSTAPKDGRPILVCVPSDSDGNCYHLFCWSNYGDGAWEEVGEYRYTDDSLSHAWWWDLPNPPDRV